jgi:hypothetical protein
MSQRVDNSGSQFCLDVLQANATRYDIVLFWQQREAVKGQNILPTIFT